MSFLSEKLGNVTIQGSSCLYTIGDLYSLKTVLLPLLDEYNLLTSKWLDYLDFKSVVNDLYTTGSSRLSADKLARVISTRNIWVYDNGVLVNEKPFTTFASANASYWILSY